MQHGSLIRKSHMHGPPCLAALFGQRTALRARCGSHIAHVVPILHSDSEEPFASCSSAA
jgi:hypothetical protein